MPCAFRSALTGLHMSTAYSRLTTCEASKLQHKTNTTFKANTSIRSNYTYNYSRRPKHELAEITTKAKAYTNTTIYGTRLIFQVFDVLRRIYRNSSESCASARLHSVSRQLSMLAGVRFSGMLRRMRLHRWRSAALIPRITLIRTRFSSGVQL